MLFDALKRLKSKNHDLHFARGEIAAWSRKHLERAEGPTFRVIDLGLGGAGDLLGIRRACEGLDLELYGIESQEHLVRAANDAGIVTYALDIERNPLPARDEFFDVVIANHVIEHTKELYWIFSEISRVLKRGGIAIIGCPNLGSWHNRVTLLLGWEPPCMRLLGPHVRGITKAGFRAFIEHGGYFELLKHKGSNFYPFSDAFNRALARLLPTLAASQHFVIRRTAKPGPFIEILDDPGLGTADTPFFRGEAESHVVVETH